MRGTLARMTCAVMTAVVVAGCNPVDTTVADLSNGANAGKKVNFSGLLLPEFLISTQEGDGRTDYWILVAEPDTAYTKSLDKLSGQAQALVRELDQLPRLIGDEPA